MARQYGTPSDEDRNKRTGPSRKDPEPKPKAPDASPEARTVEQFHKNSDIDVRKESQHHTLGAGPTQASPGPHKHDGGDSALLLDDTTLTGSKTTTPPTCLASIIAALVRLGAKDSTT